MRYINFLFILFLLSACKEAPKLDPIAPPFMSNGLLVLNEGLFQQNNASLSWVDFQSQSVSNQLFEQRTNRSLGDTGNDLQRYGNKIYIVVSVSSTLEVLDANLLTPLKQIQMTAGGTAKQPRSICFHQGYAYISCYDGYVDVLDTTNLELVHRIPVGLNPEGLTVANNKLYVSNSGGLNAPQMDSTVSVVDLNSWNELDKIVVGQNPGGLITDDQGDVYVVVRGNYGSVPSRMKRIDSGLDEVVESFPFDVSGFSKFNDKLLLSYFDFNSQQSNIHLFNPTSEAVEVANYIDCSGVTILYGMHYDAPSNQIYISDAMGYTNSGYVRVFSANGVYIKSYSVGLNPSKIVSYD